MIDLGLGKLAIVGVVALIVIGPEKLPRVARMAGSLFGRAQRYINDVKAEVGREIEMEELRKMQKEMRDAASDVQQSVSKEIAEVERGFPSDRSDDGDEDNRLIAPPTPDQFVMKIKDFRKKKLDRSSAVPAWYKKKSGHRSRVISAAARVAKYRPGSRPGKQFF
jgi:sec-independent protein translocase protein TatB